VTGVWAEEIDALYDKEIVPIVAAEGNEAGLTGRYDGGILADLLHTDSATILATYGGEFYEGRPAVTVNEFGEGRAYYVASRNDARFHGDFFKHLIDTLKLKRALNQTMPDGITAATRTDGQYEYVFLLSFAREAHKIDLGKAEFQDLLTGEKVAGSIQLASYTSRILKRPIKA
jgi:beta-galactosidase